MMNPDTTPFLMLDGTPEYQIDVMKKFVDGIPLETISEVFERMGMEMTETVDTTIMETRGKEFIKRYEL